MSDARGLMDCWGCGEPAPGGVCLRAHPEYRHQDAVDRQMVVNLDIRPIAMPVPRGEGPQHAYQARYWRDVKKQRAAQRRFEDRLRAAQRTREAIQRMTAA